ncbi:MAG: hypothetical protein CVV06_00710 [Gammaproteobacteria bacterium HGW-Gammaproteobacteria-10]|nr:MAG: hypothetical protein CVV06_00710 [Gammaproteobacteria bacterium HGW-Gammaproteobacteria-10]
MPVLVDTSVWIDHFRKKEPALVGLLENGQVLGHPFVRGELALASSPDEAARNPGIGAVISPYSASASYGLRYS